MPKHQSTYRRYHSTDTTLLKVYNDLLMATDNGQISAVCLQDLTAAFDIVNHDLLLQRLEQGLGIRGLALAWFRSYLTGRTFCVVFAGITSTTKTVTCSVLQETELGPLLFILYTADFSELAATHVVTLSAFADDTFTATATVLLLPWAHWSCVLQRWAIGCQQIVLNLLMINRTPLDWFRTQHSKVVGQRSHTDSWNRHYQRFCLCMLSWSDDYIWSSSG